MSTHDTALKGMSSIHPLQCSPSKGCTDSAPLESSLFERFGHQVEVLIEDGENWIKATDWSGPLKVNKRSILKNLATISPKDLRVISIHTKGGPQKAQFVNESGSWQLAQQCRTEAGARVREFLGDLAVKYRRGELGNTSTAPLLARIDSLENVLVRVLEKLSAPIAIGRPMTYRTKFGTEVLVPRERTTPNAQAHLDNCVAGAYLLAATGSTKGAAGLCQRTIAYLVDKGEGFKVKRFSRGQSHETYLPREALRFVHTHDIRTGRPAPAEVVQGGLFDESGKPKLSIVPAKQAN